jgi:hypothetical protein
MEGLHNTMIIYGNYYEPSYIKLPGQGFFFMRYADWDSNEYKF